jgi:hypothetical protein
MTLLIGDFVPMMKFDSRAEAVVHGRRLLMRYTGKDFGYDPTAWHRYLVETNAGGYKWGRRHLTYAKRVEKALVDDEWRHAVALAESECLLEKQIEREARQREAVDAADREWRGQFRDCPKCSSRFKSVGDRGQCPHCGHLFYASHPASGGAIWWLEI